MLKNESQAEGLSGDTRLSQLHAHGREHARVRKAWRHAGYPTHADQGGGAILRGLLPALLSDAALPAFRGEAVRKRAS
jgi:hypothetical protein